MGRWMDDAKRVAVVTGAATGMGLETCRQLAACGFHVVLTARDAAKAQAAAALAGPGVEGAALDVTQPAQARALAQRLADRFGRLDVLVNNAGAFFEPTDQAAGLALSVLELQPDVLAQSLQTNALGALNVSQALVPLMARRRWGRVVNVSSSMGALAQMQRGWPAYRMSKTLLNAVTRLLAAEVAELGVKVNSVCPGWVRTGMGGPHAGKSVEEGVDTTVWLATLPDDGPTGGFFLDRQPIAW